MLHSMIVDEFSRWLCELAGPCTPIVKRRLLLFVGVNPRSTVRFAAGGNGSGDRLVVPVRHPSPTPHTLYAGVNYGRGSTTALDYFVRRIRRAHGRGGTAAQAA